MLPLPPIAPVELMLMTVGLKAIISRKVERFGKAKLAQADAIPAQIGKLARKMVHDELEAGFYNELSYRGTLKDLARGWDQTQVEEMVAQFPREYSIVGSALVVKAKEMIDALLEGFPIAQYSTVTGSTNLTPSDTKQFKFISILEVIDNPLMLFSLISTGALLKKQAKAIREIYPTFSAAVDAAILQATITAKAEKKSFELTPRAEVGVKAWFGKGPIEPDALRHAQDAVQRSKDKNDQRAQANAAKADAARSDMTATQKLEADTA